MAFKIDAKFEGKLTCAFKNWHEEFGKFSPEHLKVSKLEPYGILLSKIENIWA